MFLTSAVRDFQSLISTINIELEWENEKYNFYNICFIHI
jgi:hypothetical protein